VLSGAAAKGGPAVLLAGREPVGTLCAVYHYLERACGVGFFSDGEHVPRRAALPAAGIRIAESPRFDNRLHLAWNAHCGLKKYHSCWWTAEEWKRELDWMAKHRLNMVRVDMTYYSTFAGDAFLQAFPEIGPDKDEITYLPGNQYGESRQISPYDPRCYDTEKRYLMKVIELFGTDHLSMATPYVDSLPDDAMYIYETAADLSALYRKHGFWHGKRWAFGVINAFAGKEALHGNCEELIERVNEAAACPTCTGVFMVPELAHANVPFWDLVTRLAWRPGRVRRSGGARPERSGGARA
jgi:hypothetical protein